MSQRLSLPGWGATCLTLGLAALIAGCGGKSAEPPENAGTKPSGLAEKSPVDTPTSNVSAKSDSGKTENSAGKTGTESAVDKTASTPPKEGTPQWFVHQILLLRFEKYSDLDDLKKVQAQQRERNLKIIKLAEECVAITHKDEKLEDAFNAAVHQLVESRVAMALQGKDEDIAALYDLANVLFKRKKDSKAAAEAAYKVAVFANTNATRYPDPKTGWLDEFVRRARLFATDFPQEKSRAVNLLEIAGRSCEINKKTEDAIKCYEQLRKQYPEMIQAQYATSVLRRLQLNGRRLEMAGPTIDGGFIDVKDFKGRIVLITFWSSDRKSCQEMLPKLKAIEEKHGKAGFSVIGVNLDQEEPVVDTFLEKSNLTWPQIFYADRQKRRWDNLIVKHYGIRDLPTLWLIDQNGVVVDTLTDPAKLEKQIPQLLQRAKLSSR